MVLAVILCEAPVGAQGPEERYGRRASLMSGASAGDGGTALALTAALGFRLADRVGVEFELTYARKLDFAIDLCPPPRVCIIGGQVPVTGRTVSLLPQVTFELLPASSRLRAYAQAGAGAGHLRQRYWFPGPSKGSPGAVEFTRSSLSIAVAYGGGFAVRVSRRLAVGGDVRWLHVLDDEPPPSEWRITPSGTLSSVRAGLRSTWRF